MKYTDAFDVIIVGGSYSGLAAAMALGRALRKVLLVDSGKPCNRQTPYSHNFLTRDGAPPLEIAAIAREQLKRYNSVRFFSGLVTEGNKTEIGFEIHMASGERFVSRMLIFATGIRDIMPAIPGFSECWGITALHCPYCHGYEVRNQKTAILGNGDYGYEFSMLISNWTAELTLYTNGKSTLTAGQTLKLEEHGIRIVEEEVEALEHTNGYLENLRFKDGSKEPVQALYTRLPFEQHCPVPEALGCELTAEGYIKTDAAQKTSVHGVFASGDAVSRMRTVANAVAMGTTAGMMLNKELIEESF